MIPPQDFIHEQDARLTKRLFLETPLKSWFDKLHENNFDAICDYVCTSSLPEISQGTLIDMRDLACEKFGVAHFSICRTRDYDMDLSFVGYNSPVVLIPDSLIRHATEDILQARLYAQAAAAAAGHHKLTFFIWAAQNMSGISGLPIIGQAVIALLYEWNRVRQFSLDRAVLLATGDFSLALKNILFGVVPNDVLEKFQFGSEDDTFLDQTRRYFNHDNPAQIVGKVFGYFSDFSWLPRRYEELRKFYKSGGRLQ